MLLQEKMKNTKFSPSEEIVIDFILIETRANKRLFDNDDCW
ncbi:MAG: hypothetical protein ACLRQF_19435 [Thomasclavelia ramosa]